MTRTTGFILCLIVGVAALYLGLVIPRAVRAGFYLVTALPIAFIAIAGFLVALLSYYLETQKLRTRQQRRLLLLDQLVAVVIAILVVSLVPARSLIEADESAMVLAAMAAQHTGGVVVPGAGIVDSAGSLHATAAHIEKRGTGYPVLVMMMTKITGSPVQAAFAINAVSLTLLLFLIARIARRYLEPSSAMIAVLLACAFPLATVIARTGTYDTVNATLLILLAHLTLSCWHDPRLLRFPLLATTAMLVAQMRYESVLVAVMAISVVQIGVLTRSVGSWQRCYAALLPMLLVPVVWRFSIPLDAELPNPQAQAWSLQNIADNAYALAHWTVDWKNWSVGNPVVGLMALLSLLLFIFRKRSSQERWLGPDAIILATFSVGLLGALLFSFWGDIEYTITSRYFVFYSVILALLAAGLVDRLRQPASRSRLLLLYGFAGILCTTGLINARRGDGFYNPLPDYRDAVVIAVNQAYGRCNILLTTVFPGVFISHDMGAIHYQNWQQNERILPGLLEQLGVVAVVAPLATVQGGGYYGEYYRDQVKDARQVGEHHGLKITANLHELWRSEHGIEGCQARRTIVDIDPIDLKTAASGLLTRPPPAVNLL